MTGKSTMIKRFCEDRFEKRHIATIGVDYGVKKVNIKVREESIDIRVNFWDLSGDPDYLEVRNEIYEGTDAVFLVFDVSNKSSFESLDSWLSEIVGYRLHPEKIPIVLCANKTDNFSREISEKEGSKYAALKKLIYFETSVYSGCNVTAMFQYLVSSALEKMPERLQSSK